MLGSARRAVAAHPPSQPPPRVALVRSDRPGSYLAPRPVSTTNSHSWWTDKRGPVTDPRDWEMLSFSSALSTIASVITGSSIAARNGGTSARVAHGFIISRIIARSSVLPAMDRVQRCSRPQTRRLAGWMTQARSH
jgi:hypothetical protein